jgi:hypothetical protein
MPIKMETVKDKNIKNSPLELPCSIYLTYTILADKDICKEQKSTSKDIYKLAKQLISKGGRKGVLGIAIDSYSL